MESYEVTKFNDATYNLQSILLNEKNLCFEKTSVSIVYCMTERKQLIVMILWYSSFVVRSRTTAAYQ